MSKSHKVRIFVKKIFNCPDLETKLVKDESWLKEHNYEIAAMNCSGISVPRDRIEQRIDEMAKQDCSIWNTMFHPRAHNYILSEGETGSDWNSNIPFPTPPSFKRFAEIFKPRLVSRPSNPSEVSFATGQIYLKPKQASVKNNEIDNCFECGREDNWRSLCECCPNQIRASIAWHQTFAHELVHFSALHASTASWYKYYKKFSSIGLMLAFVFLGVAICFPHHDISYAFWIFFLLFLAIFLQDIHFNYYNFPRWRGWRTSYAVEEIVALS